MLTSIVLGVNSKKGARDPFFETTPPLCFCFFLWYAFDATGQKKKIRTGLVHLVKPLVKGFIGVGPALIGALIPMKPMAKGFTLHLHLLSEASQGYIEPLVKA